MDAVPRRAHSAEPVLVSSALPRAQPPAFFQRARSSDGPAEEARDGRRPRPVLGRVQSKWKRSAAPASEEELEALLDDDPEEALEFEELLDRCIRSKDAATHTLQWAKTKLPPTLALFVTEAFEPYSIVVANKRWREVTKHRDAINKTVRLLLGVDSDKSAIGKVFGGKEEVSARLWHYTGDEKPFINNLTVFPLVESASDGGEKLPISHYLGVMRCNMVKEDASKDMINQLRKWLTGAGVLGVLSKADELERQLRYSGRGKLTATAAHVRAEEKHSQCKMLEERRTAAMEEGRPTLELSDRVGSMHNDHAVFEGIQRRRSLQHRVQVHMCQEQAARIDELQKHVHTLARQLPGYYSTGAAQRHERKSDQLAANPPKDTCQLPSVTEQERPSTSLPTLTAGGGAGGGAGGKSGGQDKSIEDSWSSTFSRADRRGCVLAKGAKAKVRATSYIRRSRTSLDGAGASVSFGRATSVAAETDLPRPYSDSFSRRSSL